MPSSEVFKMEPKALHSSVDISTQQKWLKKAIMDWRILQTTENTNRNRILE